ncbi:hypothetical protein NAP1_06940 [Erythrobacter sp. NAP1]|uniref:hypothetical protein n=1 Tax=Erythrobacter sp. NAP1 TaxID=237727 RepID=UPI0000686AB5|nr:hypothetical protein [Erythrobacter sp. NAP1]EAQ30494.1 hypothetical protein NAP1_06940 [Erythrobacter sp. NAP1]
MPSLLALAAPFALILPVLGQGFLQAESGVNDGEEAAKTQSTAPDFDERPEAPYSPANTAATPLDAFYGGQVARQVRIDRRVTIRITPRRESPRNSLLARLPQRGMSLAYEERDTERCVPMARISGVQTGTGNRLLLFLRDNRIFSVNLERACRARDFYAGFYIERSEDGQLCVERDQLQSRSGAKCEVEAMRQLVVVQE